MNIEMREQTEDLFTYFLETRLTRDAYQWLCESGAEIQKGEKNGQLSRVFAQIPRYATKELLGAQDKAIQEMEAFIPGYNMGDWTVETLCRVWILAQVPGHDMGSYVTAIERLFMAAELNELVALYKSLPLLQYPEHWVRRCEEGIRSNMGNVLEAIMYHNPYPANYLPEASWNQMILKAFFTEKTVTRIYGLQTRLNPALKTTLADYVQERVAAGRSVNPELYRLLEG